MDKESRLLCLMVTLCIFCAFFCVIWFGVVFPFFGLQSSASALVHDTTEVVVVWYVVMKNQIPEVILRATLIIMAYSIIALIAFWRTKKEFAPITFSFLVVVFGIFSAYNIFLDESVWGLKPYVLFAIFFAFCFHLALYYAVAVKKIDLYEVKLWT